MLDDRGKRNLKGVHPRLAAIVLAAAGEHPKRLTIIDNGGLRTPAAAADNVARGTGVLNSLHLPQADGFSHAIDLLPTHENGAPKWSVEEAKEINARLFKHADDDDFPLQNGADWDLDGKYGEHGESDWHHTQIPRAYKMKAATAAMNRRKEERRNGLSPWITPGLSPEDMRDEDFDDRPGKGPKLFYPKGRGS